MTVSDLKGIVQNNVDDTVDATVLLGWLNRGYEYLQQFIIIPDLETSASLTFAAGLADLPDDFMHLVELKIGDTYYREEIDFEERNDYQGPGAYYFWGTKIGVVSNSDPSIAGTGTLAYVQMDAALSSDASVPKLRTIFQPLIAEYAIGLYRQNAGNYAKATVHFVNVDNGIERLTGKLRRRTRRQLRSWGDVRDRYPNYP